MLKRNQFSFFLTIMCGAMCMSFSPVVEENNTVPPNYYRNGNLKNNTSKNPSEVYRPQRIDSSKETGREEVAYIDERDQDIHQRAQRMGDWEHKENWRYNRSAFYAGENQPDPYNEQDVPYSGGIGRDRDDDYVRMMQGYYESTGQRNQPNERLYQQNHQGQNGQDYQQGRLNQDGQH